MMAPPIIEEFSHSGSKYLRRIQIIGYDQVDVYAVLEAFNVTCPARQHAIKKLLCAGIRGKADETQDIEEAKDAVDRAIQMSRDRHFKASNGVKEVESFI